MLRAVVIGAGSIGREYALRHLVASLGVEVVAVVDANLDLARTLANDVAYQRAGGEVYGSKYREQVHKDGISVDLLPQVAYAASLQEVSFAADMVYIGTPPNSHAALTMQALEMGKHVLLEKPLAISGSDGLRIVEAAEQAKSNGQHVAVNIGMRYNQAILKLKSLISTHGAIASMSLRLLFQQWPRAWQEQPWVAQRAEGGPMREVGTHWLFGILELLDHPVCSDVSCSVIYPCDLCLCELSVTGSFTLQPPACRAVPVEVQVQSVSEEAQLLQKDIYELYVCYEDGSSYVLYDFTRLRAENGREVNVDGDYGRQACVRELVKAITGEKSANIVTAAHANNALLLLNKILKIDG